MFFWMLALFCWLMIIGISVGILGGIGAIFYATLAMGTILFDE